MDDVAETVVQESGPTDALDTVKIESFDGIGPLTMGVGGNWHILMTALCLLNDPQVNKFMLAQKLNMSDRMTKTKIFPREGMVLPHGEFYQLPEENTKEG